MAHEVVVVGGGIGGLTAAALLAARGVSVCLFERAPRGGGCVGGFQKFGYDFETTAGLYSSWGAGELHERVFAELPAERPEARRLTPAYVVRLPDGTDVEVGGAGGAEFEETLRASFPECAARAVKFYGGLAPLAAAAAAALERFPAPTETSKLQRARLAASDPRAYRRLTAARAERVAAHLAGTSARFRAFVEAQLRAFALSSADECSYTFAACALTAPQRGLYSLRGGAAALAEALTDALKRSGGAVRFDAPVLRLAYDAAGRATGVDLLSGERVAATRAVVSNLTVWDTYGKLVGAGRVPSDVRARLKTLTGRSAYLLFLGADEEAITRLPATHLLAARSVDAAHPVDNDDDDPARSVDVDDDDPARSEFFFSASPAWDARAPGGKRAVTVSTFAEAEDWFTFHEDESAHEEQDAAALAAWWARLHAALPELGAGIEVIETLTPRDYYEQTRRRLGLVCGTPRTPAALQPGAFTHRTHLPNLYMVGDTIFPGGGLAGVTRSALAVANEIAPPR